mmetsp:Transcript_34536/g.58101  ORF Transcript_34536/g.58101 Transcript_34536/m.58101 type:complete len:209 (+) Transcript_34536:72-698(+)
MLDDCPCLMPSGSRVDNLVGQERGYRCAVPRRTWLVNKFASNLRFQLAPITNGDRCGCRNTSHLSLPHVAGFEKHEQTHSPVLALRRSGVLLGWHEGGVALQKPQRLRRPVQLTLLGRHRRCCHGVCAVPHRFCRVRVPNPGPFVAQGLPPVARLRGSLHLRGALPERDSRGDQQNHHPGVRVQELLWRQRRLKPRRVLQRNLPGVSC